MKLRIDAVSTDQRPGLPPPAIKDLAHEGAAHGGYSRSKQIVRDNHKTAYFGSTLRARLVSLTVAVLLAGCTLHPPGEKEERAAAGQLGANFQKRIEVREIEPLPAKPTPDQLVMYAMLNNADLEQRYWNWRAAIEQVPQDGTQSATLNVAGGTSITRGRTSWSSSTITLANDPMTDIKWPGKLDAAAKQSLENARAAGRRFLKAKYDLRSKVLSAYYDYALTGELIRLEQENLQLLVLSASTSEARNRAGSAGLQDVLKAKNEVDRSRNDLAAMQAQLPGQAASINALLGRAADAPLSLPSELPKAEELKYPDVELVQLAARNNPELIALADETRGREQGVLLAKLQYVPDFNFSAGTDLAGVTQSILGQVTVPVFRYEALNAAIAQAEANLRAAESMRRQTASDLAQQVIGDISTLRDADRQLDLLSNTVLPREKQVVDLDRSAYETGHASLLDLLESQRGLILIERLTANLRVVREKRVADLEGITAMELTVR